MELTQEYLRHLFTYTDGNFYNRVRRSIRAPIGKIAGSVLPCGYKYVTVDYKPRRLHRLIYMYHHGHLPKCVDHIDRNPLNNRIENLRGCTQSQNMCNAKRRDSGSSQYTGVWLWKKRNRWVAYISINKKRTTIGYFKTEIEAALARDAKALELHGEFAMLNIAT